MKAMYLLRGIGIGIIIGSLITFVSFKTLETNNDNKKEITSEISTENKAEAESTDTEKVTETTTEKVTEATTEKVSEKETEKETEVTTEKATEKETEATTEKKTEATTEKKTEATTEKKTEATTEKATEATTEKPTEKPTEATTEEPTEENASGEIEVVIAKGSSSTSAAKALEKAGVISDYKKFDSWLCKKGYDRYVSAGTYKLSKSMEYEDIAKIIIKK